MFISTPSAPLGVLRTAETQRQLNMMPYDTTLNCYLLVFTQKLPYPRYRDSRNLRNTHNLGNKLQQLSNIWQSVPMSPDVLVLLLSKKVASEMEKWRLWWWWEYPYHEVACCPGLKSGGDDDVAASRQLKSDRCTNIVIHWYIDVLIYTILWCDDILIHDRA